MSAEPGFDPVRCDHAEPTTTTTLDCSLGQLDQGDDKRDSRKTISLSTSTPRSTPTPTPTESTVEAFPNARSSARVPPLPEEKAWGARPSERAARLSVLTIPSGGKSASVWGSADGYHRPSSSETALTDQHDPANGAQRVLPGRDCLGGDTRRAGPLYPEGETHRDARLRRRVGIAPERHRAQHACRPVGHGDGRLAGRAVRIHLWQSAALSTRKWVKHLVLLTPPAAQERAEGERPIRR